MTREEGKQENNSGKKQLNEKLHAHFSKMMTQRYTTDT